MGTVILSHKVTVYVPTRSHSGKDLSNDASEYAERVAHSLSKVCGGATQTEGLGYWVGETGLVTERVILVTAYADDSEAAVKEALRLANWLREALNQEAVSVEVNGELHLVG